MKNLSLLQKKRMGYKPISPKILEDFEKVSFVKGGSKSSDPHLRSLFPKTFDLPQYVLESNNPSKPSKELKIGVFFSGGPAAGGHNVICALFDTKAKIIGFLDGPSGVIENRYIEIDSVDIYRNQGGFDLIGSGRTKFETKEQFEKVLKTVDSHKLDGLVVIGGDDSNTNAALLAEYFLEKGCGVKVIGVPKTIDGDLRSSDIEISFGFDSACKTYSELIGNLARDALSSKKYYHFVKLMGRSASHIALECALSTQPNLTLIGEERRSLDAIVDEIASLVIARHSVKKDYGIILIPEGLIEFVPELGKWAEDLNLPKDPHGNIQVSKIETGKFLIERVKRKLEKQGFQGEFHAQEHFFGYEGRSCMPTNFDATYCYALGRCAYLAIRDGLTGVICAIQSLKGDVLEWKVKAIPILELMHMEKRGGKEKPVIAKALVDLEGKPYRDFVSRKKSFEIEDAYIFPGPIQFFGEKEITDSVPITLKI